MTAIVKVTADDQPVKVIRVEEQGGSVILGSGQHMTFTVRPGEAITIEGEHRPLPKGIVKES